MIIYQTTIGKGYNPLFPLNSLLPAKIQTVSLNPVYNKTNRVLACANIIISICLITFLSMIIASDRVVPAAGIALLTITVFSWHLASALVRNKNSIKAHQNVHSKDFVFCWYTFEWIVVFLSTTLLFLYLRSIEPPLLPDSLLALLASLSAAMLFLPLAQGSRYLLTRK
jgi:hypothetical protein